MALNNIIIFRVQHITKIISAALFRFRNKTEDHCIGCDNIFTSFIISSSLEINYNAMKICK